LDASFGPDAITPGATSTLTFTITNTSELGDKDGWSFSDALPAGVTVAGAATTDCAAGTITAPAGGTSISVTDGDIAAGVTSCTVTVPVTAAAVGIYTVHPSDVSLVGLDAPADTALTVAAVVGTPMVNSGFAGGVAVLVLLTAGGVFFVRRRRTAQGS
jgi:uncharacterized repeat protein (TIGR01451 family)